MGNSLHPAGRTCLACAEPLSIQWEGDRCMRCVYSYQLRPMNPLQRRVTAAREITKRLAGVPKFELTSE